MAASEAALQSMYETHLATLRTHRAMLLHMVELFKSSGAEVTELESMRSRADTVWEDANQAGELLGRVLAPGVARTMREETPARPRRISNGPPADDVTSTSYGGDLDTSDQEEQNIVRAKGRTNISAGVVLANLPQGISAKDITTMLRPLVIKTIVGPSQRPKRSDIKQYELPAFSHQHGFAIAELANETEVIKAVTSLVGTAINGQALIVRSFKALPTNKTGSKRRVSGTPAVSPTEPNRKRQRTGEPEMCAPADPLTSAAGPSRTPASVPAPEPPVEYEDISAEVEARLEAQAAKRAAARKGKAAGDKRKRSSGGSLADATDGVRRMSVVGAAEETTETRPKKRARDADAEESPASGPPKSTAQPTVAEPEMNSARATSRESRRDRRKRLLKQTTDPPLGMTSNGEQGQVDDSSRPQKRWRADVTVNESTWVR